MIATASFPPLPLELPILLPAAAPSGGVLNALLECDSVGIAVTDRSFRYLLWNRFMEGFTGLRAEEVLGRNALEVYPHLREEGLERVLRRVLEGETVTAPDAPYRIPVAGRRGWVSAQYSPHQAPDGGVLGVVGVLTDVTERKRAEDESRRLAAIARESPAPVLECEPTGAIRYANPAALRLADELGLPLEAGVLPAAHGILARRSLRHGRPRTGVETRPGGRVFSWGYHPQPALGVVHLFGEDVTARREAECQLRHQAAHDPLTGLPNRALCLDRLARAAHRARLKPDRQVAVLFLDLDRFKVINDSLGHHVGDEMLIAVAERLRGCVRDGDVVARLGGDEFVILLNGADLAEEAMRAAERIHASLAEPVGAGGYRLFTTASIGIAVSGPPNEEPSALLRQADVAMYRAKASGPSRTVRYDAQIHDAVCERLRLETELRHAIDRGELALFYQPVVELESGQVVSFEALVRWRHPRRGLVQPAEFVPLAEETGLIHELGRWTLEEACAQLSRWGARALPVAANVSARQLAAPGLAERVGALLSRYRVSPSLLRLEITEGALVECLDAASDALAQLRELGVQVLLDDFGTGYSSLAYLARLPVDAVKVDRCFVAGLEEDPLARRMARLVITLGEDLGLGVIAEGVEQPGQLAELRALGCRYAQGFLLGTAEDADAAAGRIPPARGTGTAAGPDGSRRRAAGSRKVTAEKHLHGV